MLKALELYGFKSFADRTRFEFPQGITVVVGPNGSGKSNVVDAIRWVLGEQSAKSLRGAEMSDVIFKGSGSGQRKPANTAEVTIVFDNGQGLLDIDAPEVLVTRRVYRSGEGEYLINDEPCRLRDVKDLFRGTGVGTDAYSLIEQGKVDTLLQASPKERRAIFEEAAGISRFRAKKVESQRRLERVEQNLLRLSDIVEEVERRLKNLRNQATKAQRYQEYTDRLKELRTHIGLTDFRQMSHELRELEVSLGQVVDTHVQYIAAVAEAEQVALEDERRLESFQQEIREYEVRSAKARETIASREASMVLQRRTLEELTIDSAKNRRRLMELKARSDELQIRWNQSRADLLAAEEVRVEMEQRVEVTRKTLESIAKQLEERETAVQQQRLRQAEQMQATSKLGGQLRTLESELMAASQSISREVLRETQIVQELTVAANEREKSSTIELELRQLLDQATQQQDAAQKQLRTESAALAQIHDELLELQKRRATLTERARVMEEVEKRLEGILSGTKELLLLAKQQPFGPLAEIHGMVADLVEVQVDMAPMIDAALGERSQYLVTSGEEVIRAIARGEIALQGRVGLIPLSLLPPTQVPSRPASWRDTDVIGPAVDYVHVEPAWRGLVEYLLAQTWVVDSLEGALRLRGKVAGPGTRSPETNRGGGLRTAPVRFVTRTGEVLEEDGTMHGGPRQGSTGLVSRRSELRLLRSQILELDAAASRLEGRLAELRRTVSLAEQELMQWTTERKELSERFAAVHAQAESARQREQQLASMQKSLADDLGQLRAKEQELSNSQVALLDALGSLEVLVDELEVQLSEHHVCMGQLTVDRSRCEQQATLAQVEFAKAQQQVLHLQGEVDRCEQDQDERIRAILDLQQQLDRGRQRHSDISQSILQGTSFLATEYLEQEAAEQASRRCRGEQVTLEEKRREATLSVRRRREELNRLEEQRHRQELEAGEKRLKLQGLIERLREDYAIELTDAQLQIEAQGERSEIDAEIHELRRKISNMGAVNMESLVELQDVEARFQDLSGQYHDLVQAKEAIERIIQRINVDSRRMFEETLQSIRESFATLFRRAFGGGRADIVVEEGVDLLESGIDIVATPPGKQSLNISLLSGGERALTAVTLLLAIFRYRPSPFCILDEVDGPLDEANIGRFIDVLKGFLEQTKLVIVTHSKKTMSAASTLYGVTMQESGVSKRVSVQFSDVSEDGEIRENAGEAPGEPGYGESERVA